MDALTSSESDELSKYDIYGRTPPRTKILRKNRERKNRYSSSMVTSRNTESKVGLLRRNTVDTIYDDVLPNPDNSDTSEGTRKTNKRHMKLLRGSERDLKLHISTTQTADGCKGEQECSYPKTPSYQIECTKPFMSLMCRTFPCSKIVDNTNNKAPIVYSVADKNESVNDEDSLWDNCSPSKAEFYQTLKALIRMGSGDKCLDRNTRRALSHEETLWQNELKDVIWLELQAYRAERTPTEEDCYLCSERENVEPLLNDIKNYKFQRASRRYSTQNSDSGLEDDCSGCLSIYCLNCLEAQNDALREIESLLNRLENVENLFPSSKAFAELYPLYNSLEIVGRVKAMCLWYNMVKHQRLKLKILGKFITMLDTKQEDWPLPGDDSTSGSPSDSNNSTNSSSSDCMTSFFDHRDIYDVAPIAVLLSKKGDFKDSPYRRYIENVLKTRALNKSIKFLNSLHQNVLQKTKLTLIHWDADISSKVIFDVEEEELRRFGAWSPEAINMNLPSYRAMFLFLALVPLEVVNAYLQMRLEQKPEKPSPLSVRQLMRELKDGLQFALHERQLACSYIEHAISGTGTDVNDQWEKISCVDKCIIEIFKDYLEYLQKWILINKHTFQKNFVEEEYKFCVEVCDHMDSCIDLMDETFTNIFCSTLTQLGNGLIEKIEDILSAASDCEQGSLKQTLFSVCRELQNLFNRKRELSLKIMAFGKACFKKLGYKKQYGRVLTEAIVGFKCIIPCAIAKVQALFEHISIVTLEDMDKSALNSRIREILMQCYRFGFDFYKEMSDATPPEFRNRLVQSMVEFASLWMKFVTERCERGRGMRPRWAYQGMEFLLTVCEPENTQHLSEKSFENLKKEMDVCISHVIGTSTPTTPDSGFYSISPRTSLEQIRSRSRGSSPCARPAYKSQRSGMSRKTSTEQTSPGVDTFDGTFIRDSNKNDEKNGIPIIRINPPTKTHADRYREAVDALEKEVDSKLKQQNLIGRVIHDRASNKNTLYKRIVMFSWQRGIKIGQGRFGKVYTAVNINTGDMMAVKEITLHHNDSTTVKRAAEEMKILEGIVHDNLVRYYGVEIHKEEMLLFMEFCSEGTLENLIAASEGGLSELLVRRYTSQLVSGVACLHEHGIVHRDIKTANIFLTNEGNCLKIGDFGCAVKIKSNVTMPGELKGFVGTQAYMAPEVFTRNMTEGHGRAADIWSVGCVVVEMASGKRPWAQYDSNFQIMFKVGMGQSPDPPDDMIDEGLDFLDMCFKHDPKERATARELLVHNFIKIGEDLTCC